MQISRALAIAFLLISAGSAWGQTSGGESGYDTTLEAIEPSDEPMRVGLAGDDPADIGRYLLAASGGAGQRATRAGDARLSPDGRIVAFPRSITGVPQLWVVSAQGGQPRQLTYGNGITFFRWLPDGSGLIYGADNDGNEQESYYVVSADGSQERLVLPAAVGGFRVFGDFVDAETIVYVSTERNRLDYDVYISDLDGQSPELVSKGSFGQFALQASPDGQFVVVSETVGEDSDNLYLLDLESRSRRPLSVPERRANHVNAGVVWKRDGSGFFLASNVDRNFAALMFFSLESGFELIEEAAGDIDKIALCGQDDRYLAWTVNEGGYSRLVVVDREDDTRLAVPDLPEGEVRIDCQGQPARLVMTVNGWKTPGKVVVWELSDDTDGRLVEIFDPGLAGLEESRLVRPESLTMTARDGVELQGLLYLPSATSRVGSQRPPVIFSVHGGPTSQSRPIFKPLAQYFVDRGFAFFEPNVRGSTGFGHTYTTLDDRENRLDSIRDLVDMLAFLEADGRVDARRAAVRGGSYGGYAVNAVLANFPGHFVAGVSLYGVADWVTALEVASPALKASDRIEYGDIREQRWQDFYRAQSPIRQADQIMVPVLYSHGARDPRIDIAETEVMVRNLRSRLVEAPFIRMLDEGHGWRKLPNKLFYFRREAEFLAEHLGLETVDQEGQAVSEGN